MFATERVWEEIKFKLLCTELHPTSLSLSSFQYQMHHHDDISIMKGLGKSWQIAMDVSEGKGPLNVFSRIEWKSSWH